MCRGNKKKNLKFWGINVINDDDLMKFDEED